MALNGAPIERNARLQSLMQHLNSRLTSPLPDFPALLSVPPPHGKKCHSPKPSSTNPSGSPTKEPPLQVPLTELQQGEMLHFRSPPTISQNSQQTPPPQGSPTGPLRRETPVSRAFFYIPSPDNSPFPQSPR